MYGELCVAGFMQHKHCCSLTPSQLTGRGWLQSTSHTQCSCKRDAGLLEVFTNPSEVCQLQRSARGRTPRPTPGEVGSPCRSGRPRGHFMASHSRHSVGIARSGTCSSKKPSLTTAAKDFEPAPRQQILAIVQPYGRMIPSTGKWISLSHGKNMKLNQHLFPPHGSTSHPSMCRTADALEPAEACHSTNAARIVLLPTTAVSHRLMPAWREARRGGLKRHLHTRDSRR